MKTALISVLLFIVCASAFAEDRKKTTSFQIENGALVLPGPVVFETGGAGIKEEGEAALWVVVDFMESRKDITKLRVEGHTDTTGNPEKNQKLSEARALSVAKWLVARGVDCKRLIAVGFGASKPIAENSTPEGKAKNRRMEFKMAEMRGRAIGGAALDGGGTVAGEVCD